MKSYNNQTAIQAMNIYQRARQNGRDVIVSGRGEIREVTLFDRFKEGLRSIKPQHNARNWEAEARQHITTMLIQDSQLLKPDLSKDETTALENMANTIFKLSKPSSQYWSAKLEDERANNPLLTNVLNNIKKMNDGVNPDLYRFVRPLLQNNHGDLDEAITVANLTQQLKQEKGLATNVAMIAAKNTHFAMNTFALNFKDAFELVLFSGQLVHAGKLSQSEESIENAYIIKSLTKKCNVSQQHAIEQRTNVLSVMRRDKVGIKEAVEIIARRIAILPEINSGLPKNMPISITEHIAILSQELPKNFQQQVLDDFIKLSVTQSEGPVTPDKQFDLDVERMVVSFKPAPDNQTIKPDLISSGMSTNLKFRSSQAVVTDLKVFTANDPSLTGMLTRLLNQKALAGLAVNAWQSVPAKGGAILNAPSFGQAEKNIRNQTTIFELSASGTDDIFLNCTYIQKSHLLFDAKGKEWEVNRGKEWEGDVNDRNCGQRLKLQLKFSRDELRQGISNPKIVEAPTISYFIKPAWDLIDARLTSSSST